MLFPNQARIDAQQKDAGVGHDAAENDDVVEVGTGHFDIFVMAVLGVVDQEGDGHDDAGAG